jgi:hypothetical protein
MKDSLFGKYCYIDTPGIAGKKTVYRILASGVASNTYCNVPVNAKTKPVGHRDFEPIVYVVLDTLVSDRLEILRFALKDVEVIGDIEEDKKHGEWIDKGSLSCRCSNCGCKSSKESKFCSECGAEMRGVEWVF